MAKAARPQNAAPTESKSLAIVGGKGELIDVSKYATLADPQSMEAIRYNLRDEKLSEFDLDRVRVPSGGATVFQIPTIEGIDDNASEIEGVILQVGVRRSYWQKLDPTGEPPDCYSVDGLQGIGDPGGECATCPLNEFGSAMKADGSQGRGKRCRERRMVLILRAGDRLPLVCLAPPASIKGIKQYLMRLPVPMFEAVTRLTLEKDKNKEGTAYSRVVLSYVGHIGTDSGKLLKRYAETLRNAIVAKAAVDVDYRDDDDPNTIDAVNNDAMKLPEDPPDVA